MTKENDFLFCWFSNSFSFVWIIDCELILDSRIQWIEIRSVKSIKFFCSVKVPMLKFWCITLLDLFVYIPVKVKRRKQVNGKQLERFNKK